MTPYQVHQAAVRARRLARSDARQCGPPPDRYATAVTFPSGVRWAPSDYRPLDQGVYLEYAARRTLPS